MSYAIGNVIYGIPLTEDLSDLFDEIEDMGPEHDLYEFYNSRKDTEFFPGFKRLYSAGGEPVGYLGQELMDIDECQNVKLDDLLEAKNLITLEMITKINEIISNFPKAVKDLCPEPDVWIVWSSS